MKIFLIDDNTIDLLISRKLLLKHDHDLIVTEFSKAQEAILALQNTHEPPPDLVLLDLNMPGMNGWEFLEAVKQKDYEPQRVFILTSSLDERDKTMATQYPPVKGYITKPLNTESITKVLKRSS
jgi:CheY-like chemotaxis protein